MQNKVTLIIPDLHHRWQQAENIIGSVLHDEVVFLGDYFDDFNDTPEMVSDTCEWLEGSVKQPNRIHLRGNHDVHYEFTYRRLKCSGYEDWKNFIISDVLSRETWDALKWYHILDDTWLLTHAGLHSENVPETVKKLHGNRPEFLKAIGEFLDAELVNAFRSLGNNVPHWLLNAGGSRGGSQKWGGITWCDFEREFIPLKGLNQILGHTPQGSGIAKWTVIDKSGKIGSYRSDLYFPREVITDPNCSVNIDLDVYRNTHYGVWDGKTLTVGSYDKL